MSVKPRSEKVIPFGGVIVSRKDVLRHRYLRDHGLPHSETVAAVALPRKKSRYEEMREIARGPAPKGLQAVLVAQIAAILGIGRRAA